MRVRSRLGIESEPGDRENKAAEQGNNYRKGASLLLLESESMRLFGKTNCSEAWKEN